jgi:hypothetical protein
MKKIIIVEATIRVEYDASKLSADEIPHLSSGLSRTIVHQVGAGMLTGHTDALVETYDVSATILNPEDVSK